VFLACVVRVVSMYEGLWAGGLVSICAGGLFFTFFPHTGMKISSLKSTNVETEPFAPRSLSPNPIAITGLIFARKSKVSSFHFLYRYWGYKKGLA